MACPATRSAASASRTRRRIRRRMDGRRGAMHWRAHGGHPVIPISLADCPAAGWSDASSSADVEGTMQRRTFIAGLGITTLGLPAPSAIAWDLVSPNEEQQEDLITPPTIEVIRPDPAKPISGPVTIQLALSYATWRLDTPRDIRGNVRLPRPGYHRAAVAARQTDPARDYRRRRFDSSGRAQHHAVRCRYDGTYRQAYFPGDGRLGAAPWSLKKRGMRSRRPPATVRS